MPTESIATLLDSIAPPPMREPLCCPRCNRLLGVVLLGALYVLAIDKRIIIAQLPHMIVCEDCGGVWRNLGGANTDAFDTLLFRFRDFLNGLPKAALPERNWAAVPNERRDRAHRETA